MVPVGCDLVVQGSADAARFSQSRWHVVGEFDLEESVLCVGS